MSGVVYFLRCGDDGPIKIGHTKTSVYLRVRALQQTSPHVLRWIGYFDGTLGDEAAAHRLLKNSRLRGEWFNPTHEVLAFIESKCPGFKEGVEVANLTHLEQKAVVKAALAPYRYKRDNTPARTISDVAGVSIYQLWGWLSDRTMISRAEADRLAAAAATFGQISRAAA